MMNMLNGFMKMVEPAAGKILENVAINFANEIISNGNQNSLTPKFDDTFAFIDKGSEIAGKVIAHNVKKMINNCECKPNNGSEYELAKSQKYYKTF